MLPSTDAGLIEQAIAVATSDANLDLVAAVVEKSAADRAVREVDEELATAYAVRKNAREKTGRGYFDANMLQTTRCVMHTDRDGETDSVTYTQTCAYQSSATDACAHG
jgi:hypothetical protein